MSNYTKNILIGTGGRDIINKSHYLGAVCGMEKIMGETFSPVRNLLNYSAEMYLKDLPIHYIHTVISSNVKKNKMIGIFIGNDIKSYTKAANLSQEKNIIWLNKTYNKVVVFLNPEKYKSTWLGNKAIYRSRLILKTNGELIIIGPGIEKFGESEDLDQLIRKYSYCGSYKIMQLVKQQKELNDNLAVAAHLIHGSSESRFSIKYCTSKLTKKEILNAGYKYEKYQNIIKKYNPETLMDGENIDKDGNPFYFISDPALGLWKSIRN